MKNIPLAALVCAIGLTACSIEKTELTPASLMSSIEILMSDEDRAKIYVDDPLAGSTTLPMIVGESISLGLLTDPADLSSLTYPEVKWTSGDESVVTVSDKGVITAISAGTAVVSVSPATMNIVAEASIKVTVFSTVKKVTSISITDSGSHTSEFSPLPACYIGESMTLSASVQPEDATYKSVLWKSADESIATVDPVSGVVTGIAQGEVEIIATSLDSDKATASYKIYIDRIIAPVGIRMLNAPSASDIFSVGDGTFVPQFETSPAICTKSLISWSVGDTDVAKVDAKGVVTFLKYGSFDLTVQVPEEGDAPEGYLKSITMRFNVPAGFYREHFENEGGISWQMATTGGTSEWISGEENYLWFTPNKANANTLRGDVKRSGSTCLTRDFPILCFRIDDVNDLGYSRNITLDTSGNTEEGVKLSGGIGSNNNKWKKKYKCSDGSAILVYDLASQGFGKSDGTNLLPEGTVGTFTTFQLKYADIRFPDKHNFPEDPGVHYRMFWFHTFATEAELAAYLNNWSETTKITFE